MRSFALVNQIANEEFVVNLWVYLVKNKWPSFENKWKKKLQSACVYELCVSKLYRSIILKKKLYRSIWNKTRITEQRITSKFYNSLTLFFGRSNILELQICLFGLHGTCLISCSSTAFQVYEHAPYFLILISFGCNFASWNSMWKDFKHILSNKVTEV